MTRSDPDQTTSQLRATTLTTLSKVSALMAAQQLHLPSSEVPTHHMKGGGGQPGGHMCVRVCVSVCACALTHLQECSCDSTSVLGESEHEAITHQGKHWAFPCCQFDRGEVEQRAGQIIPPPHPPAHTQEMGVVS